jgi:hypothetical protein
VLPVVVALEAMVGRPAVLVAGVDVQAAQAVTPIARSAAARDVAALDPMP